MTWDHLKAALFVAGAMALWLAVQLAWRRAFPEHVGEGGDVLANRTSCGDCTCSTPCESKREREAHGEPLAAGTCAAIPDFTRSPEA